MDSQQDGYKIYYKTPMIMIGAWVLAIGTAFGHHFFYQSLNRHSVDSGLFSQQINIGIGTGFAFLFKALSSLAVGTVYVQILWRLLKSRSITIKGIDSLFSLLQDVSRFLDVRTLKSHLLLTSIAILAWTIPFASLFTPGTLTVQTSPVRQRTYTTAMLPNIDFGGSNFAQTSLSAIDTGIGHVLYNGPSYLLSSLVHGVIFQGNRYTFASPVVATNSSYTRQLFGPALNCQNEPYPGFFINQISSQLKCDFNATYDYGGGGNCGDTVYQYIAWAPVSVHNVVPFLGYVTPSHTLDDSEAMKYGGSPLAIYIATRPDASASGPEWNITSCTLYNSSYEVTVVYENGQQTLTSKVEYLNSISFINEIQVPGFQGGNVTYGEPNVEVPVVDPRSVSYQAIMDILGQTLVGGIYTLDDNHGTSMSTSLTTVMSTNLAYTKELFPLLQLVSASGASASLALTSSNMTLADALMELAQNITLSLFSKPYFLSSNDTTLTNITTYTAYNEYHYAPFHLILAYGIAGALSLVAVLVGCLVLLLNGASYSSTFSTVLRATTDLPMKHYITSRDTNGEDPLPKHLKKAKIRLGQAFDVSHVPVQEQAAGMLSSDHYHH